MTCRKCGGSGDMFHIQDPEGVDRIVSFEDLKLYEGRHEVIGEIECSLCGGFGVE